MTLLPAKRLKILKPSLQCMLLTNPVECHITMYFNMGPHPFPRMILWCLTHSTLTI